MVSLLCIFMILMACLSLIIAGVGLRSLIVQEQTKRDRAVDAFMFVFFLAQGLADALAVGVITIWTK